MVFLIFRRIVRFALALMLMLTVSGSTARIAHGAESSKENRQIAALSKSVSPASQPTPAQDSFFSLKYWTAPAFVAILSGIFIPLYLNWGKQKLADRKKSQRYRDFIKEMLGKIGMPGLPGGIRNISVDMDDGTFVKLRFSEGIESGNGDVDTDILKESRSEGLPDEVMTRAFRNGRRLLLVFGDPGAGKTTLLQYYALCALDGNQCGRLGFSSLPNVFYLPLRELDRSATLSGNLARHAKSHDLDIDAALFDMWLEAPSLVLLDGLDEISDPIEREQACRWIDLRLTGTAKGNFVVSSRFTGYGFDDERGLDITLHSRHKRAEILDFSPKQQETFLRGWFEAAFLNDERGASEDEKSWRQKKKQEAKLKGDRIIAVLKEEKNLVLRQLAGIPMILQLMALIWKENEYLPSDRIELYASSLDYMLQYRDKQKDIPAPLKAEQGRRVLAPVAWWMQKELKNDEAELSVMHRKMELELASFTSRQFTPPDATQYCEHLMNRAGVLAKNGDHYLFRHKTFREYLAGTELLKLCGRSLGFIDELIPVFGENWWNEPIRFFIARSNAEQFDYLMDRIVRSVNDEPLSSDQWRLLGYIIDEAPQKQVTSLCERLLDPASTEVRLRLALDCLYLIGQEAAMPSIRAFIDCKLAKNRDIISRAEAVLIALDPANRTFPVEATRISLASLPSSFRYLFEYSAEYILIRGGTFRYSVSGTEESVSNIYFAKCPVTNRQYRRFISYLRHGIVKGIDRALPAERFADTLRRFAVNSRVNGFSEYLQRKKDMASLFKSEFDENRKFGGDDQPVVGVSWYAATAYCLWLSLLESSGKETSLYRLPTEIEWEFAAAGSEGRTYPWGNDPPTRRHASFDNNEGTTTTVGRYPKGATPTGLYDMAGNVWEWMENSFGIDKDRDARALRGGSWGVEPVLLRCSARVRGVPVGRGISVGFRVVRPVSES
ncbi:MAG: SUMF1/EgtB/PvdO family nonheme iron enzyme [Chlorobaculum sp.]|nr:SUMF1/EgtB/PvdO family nonheme iron enzyme [Chlorobaculum sp.]